MSVEVKWEGAKVLAKVRHACAEGLNHTTTECVRQIKFAGAHEYMDRTGDETNSTVVTQFATSADLRSVWGAHMPYSAYLEVGTSRPDSGAPRASRRIADAQGRMWDIVPPQPFGIHTDTVWTPEGKIPGQGPLMAERMALRPAAFREYPLLAERIAISYAEETLPISEYPDMTHLFPHLRLDLGA